LKTIVKNFSSIFIFTTLFIESCTQSIQRENVKIKDGLYVDALSGEILDGKYKSETPSDGNYHNENVVLHEYSNGIPIGEWSDTHGGELIHSGEFLEEEDTKLKIQNLTKSNRVDLNLWKEVDFKYLTLELIAPKVSDTLTLNKVVELTKNSLFEKYRFRMIRIDSVVVTNRNFIYEREIKLKEVNENNSNSSIDSYIVPN
jgi:hypothetical protein